MHDFRTTISAFAFAALMGGTAFAQEMNTSVELSGAEEVPPVETTATGTTDVTFDSESRELSWTLNYSDLSGPATAAHFHGPAAPGANAPPVVPIENFESGAEGMAELTEEQAAQLTAGEMYVNVHTDANPGGEIRGQVMIEQ